MEILLLWIPIINRSTHRQLTPVLFQAHLPAENKKKNAKREHEHEQDPAHSGMRISRVHGHLLTEVSSQCLHVLKYESVKLI